MAVSELTCLCSAVILHDDKVTVTEEKTNVPIKARGVNVDLFWPGLLAKPLNNVNIASLICNVGAGGTALAPGDDAPSGGAAPASIAAPAEEKKKEEAKREESKESDDDMGFGLFD
ncbi:60S acidic ribosomal protein P1-like [Dromiciops gliroides]|uniref:60S acidic ribosomal protein P1-like n=1 Tax=Dromiciops gliroides TaxID=33562 RepID=UPI001CC68559|nr:60S acidic ribosomal protein P1-like [Dromiciops gliroides]